MIEISNNMPKVSVIIPTYNRVQFIAEAIDSVLNQTYADLEIIVVDDGSTDNTKSILEPYILSGKIRYFFQGNKGPAAARNKGIREAKGEYITFLDSDDLWLSEKVEKQLEFILLNPQYKMIFCDMKYFNFVKGEFIHQAYLKERQYKYVSMGNIYNNLLKEGFIFTPTVIVHKDCFSDVGLFNESYKICEDSEMWLRIANKYQVGFLDKAFVIRRKISDNITNDYFLYLSSGVNLFIELMGNSSLNRDTRKIIKTELGKKFFSLGYFCWDNGDLLLARRNFLNSVKYRINIVRSIQYLILSYFPYFFIAAIRKTKRRVANFMSLLKFKMFSLKQYKINN